ncbi:MAG TPA: 16S rRNA (cytosine(1402)-N(4))-methyltransferase RsmH [Dictyobacter sp.]|jgi:16S rRNA (cytosine1402-N4)-methyltransferase|nr:16S rRNA (cytosine(1402)-N(4))-methyltransferase RsmH [Dictyobacter sp.]
MMEYTQHVPVMLNEVLAYLQPRSGGYYIDGTLGGGGHTAALLERTAPDGKVLGIDTDEQALARVESRLARHIEDGRLLLAHGNFADLSHIIARTGFGLFDSMTGSYTVHGVLLDLGFSSDQMDSPERGFAFSSEGPLDMRLNRSLPVSAATIVNEYQEQELADIIWRYGEEPRARQIARRIVSERDRGTIATTSQLATLIAAGIPRKPGAIHPATRAFQALRIAVNQELERLEEVLPQIVSVLHKPHEEQVDDPGAGRMALISFHSLEDRIVKEFMRREAKDCICPPRIPVCVCDHHASLRIITNKPIVPTAQEIAENPRSRSAKLRVAERK